MLNSTDTIWTSVNSIVPNNITLIRYPRASEGGQSHLQPEDAAGYLAFRPIVTNTKCHNKFSPRSSLRFIVIYKTRKVLLLLFLFTFVLWWDLDSAMSFQIKLQPKLISHFGITSLFQNVMLRVCVEVKFDIWVWSVSSLEYQIRFVFKMELYSGAAKHLTRFITSGIGNTDRESTSAFGSYVCSNNGIN